jgi:hypothetical protein
MPTYRGEQNKFDYLTHFPPCRSAIKLFEKRETDKNLGSIGFVLPYYSLQLIDRNFKVRACNFSFTLSHDVKNTPC